MVWLNGSRASCGPRRRLSFLQKTVAECQYFFCNFSNFNGNASRLDAPACAEPRLMRSVGSFIRHRENCISRRAESLWFAGATDEAARDALSLSASIRRLCGSRASIPLRAGSSRVFLASSRPKEIRSAPYRSGHVAWHPAVSCHEPPGWVARQSTQVTPAKLGTSLQLALLKKQ